MAKAAVKKVEEAKASSTTEPTIAKNRECINCIHSTLGAGWLQCTAALPPQYVPSSNPRHHLVRMDGCCSLHRFEK